MAKTNEELLSQEYLIIHPDTGERYRAMGSDNLTPNFKVYEFASQDGCEVVVIDRWVLRKCQALRDYVGHAVSVGRGFSTISHNKTIPNHADDSNHLYGQAVDLSPAGEHRDYTAKEWALVCEFVCGWDCGLGVYSGHAHIDHEERRRWNA